MRCLRAGENASPALGRRGAPPGGNRTPRQELADGVSPLRPCRKRGPCRQDTAMERRGARVLSPKDARASLKRGSVGCATRRSISLASCWGRLPRTPWFEGQGEYGRTRRPAKNTGDDAWLFDKGIGDSTSARHAHLPSPTRGEGKIGDVAPGKQNGRARSPAICTHPNKPAQPLNCRFSRRRSDAGW